MNWKSFIKHPTTLLTASGLAITGGVIATFLTGGTAGAGLLITAGLLNAVGSLGANFFSSAFQSNILDKSDRNEILKNGDLIRAVGRAIFAFILAQSKIESYGEDREKLERIGNLSESAWEDIVLGIEETENPRFVLNDAELEELSPDFLTHYVASETGEIDEIKSLTPELWRKILEKLSEKEGVLLSVENLKNLSLELHKNFAKSLRKTLITDFAEDGKAYASLQLRISGEILFYIRENNEKLDEANAKLFEIEFQISQLRELLDDGLNPNSKEFDKYFNEIKDLITVNQQIIVEAINNLETKVDAVKKDTEKIIDILTNQPKNSEISKKLPISRFPSRINFFTGRKAILENIEKSLKDYQTASLFGTHGLGKSSIATEFAYLNEDVYSHVLFIRAFGAEFDLYIGEIVENLHFEVNEQTKPDEKLAMLQYWLAENENWLLILDNVNDVSAIKDCNFTSLGGFVLFTSNDSQIYQIGKKVEVPNMETKEAASLLYQHWKGTKIKEFEDIPTEKRESAKQIAEKFGNSPLAMSFVGSYLFNKNKSFDEFLRDYNKKEKNLLETYEFISDYFNHFKDTERKAVATAFLNTFQQITTRADESERETFLAEAVKDYLKICSFLSPNDMPEEFFVECLKKLHSQNLTLIEDEDFIDEVKERLYKFAIFERDSDKQTFTTHRLVQEIMRFEIKDEETRLLEMIAETFKENVPFFDYTNREEVESYLAHLQSYIEYLEDFKIKPDDVTKLDNQITNILSFKIAVYYGSFGQYETAKKYYLICRDICEKIYGDNHPEIATSYNNLGNVYNSQGDYPKAEESFLKSLRIYLNILGENHPDTATSYNNLGAVYYSQGDFQKAEENYLISLRIKLNILGENHSDTAGSYNNLGNVYDSQENFQKAEENHLKSLQIRLNVLGENHPDTAGSYNNLANVYYSQGDYPKAEESFLKSLQIYLNILGENHPLTASTYNNLGNVYDSQDDYPKAEENYLKSLRIKLNVLGENHPTTATSYGNLGLFYEKQNKFDEAEKYCQRTLEIFEKFLPETHPFIQRAKNNLARVREKLGKR